MLFEEEAGRSNLRTLGVSAMSALVEAMIKVAPRVSRMLYVIWDRKRFAQAAQLGNFEEVICADDRMDEVSQMTYCIISKSKQ